MRSDLSKLSIGDAFDEAFDLYKVNFGLLLTVAAVLYVPAQVSQGIMRQMLDAGPFGSVNPSPADMERAFGMLGLIFVSSAVFFLLLSALSGAITIVASERYLDRSITIGQAYRALLNSLPRLLVAWFAVGMILAISAVLVTFFMAIVLGMALAAAGSTGAMDQTIAIGISIVIIAVVLVLIGVLFAWLGIFITPIVMLERAGPFAAMQRNLELVRGSAWRLALGVLGLAIALYSVSMALAGCLHFGLQMLVYPALRVSEPIQLVIFSVLTGVISLFLHPLWMTTFTVMYYDQRVRNEGFDMALMLHNLAAKRARDDERQRREESAI